MRWAADKVVAAGLVAAGLVVATAVTVSCQADNVSRSAAATQSPRGQDASSSPDVDAAPGAATPTPSATAGPGSAPAAANAAGPPFCGSSQYVEEITVQRWSNGDFRVSLRPTEEARHAEDRTEATAVMWQAVRRCLTPSAGFTGLDGSVGDSLQDQLRCHEYLALIPAMGGGEGYATGETFDVESWRPKAGKSRWYSTKCGNSLGTDPTGPSQTFRPDGIQPQHTVTGEHQ